MMIAEVGGIVNVSGSRIATPFAPPSPGSTPMITPSTMPTSIRPMFSGVRITAKPCISALSSSIRVGSGSVAEKAQRVERALEQRHLEPHFEHEEEEGVDDQRRGD